WREVLNTDAETYGGSGVGNMGSVVATEEPWHGRPASATLRVPPTGVLWLLSEPEPAETTAPTTRASGVDSPSLAEPGAAGIAE
ncbi:MAG TPA: alpha amylase C-terminal domain-containing protein, partial [Pseudonocardia sp.]|uniref:alpha amylase C-terminal domain-containing protein n=1 Tax=Pseudonocardia sp. TaxID=60912 RepID=UPI002B921EE7